MQQIKKETRKSMQDLVLNELDHPEIKTYDDLLNAADNIKSVAINILESYEGINFGVDEIIWKLRDELKPDRFF